MLACIDAYPKMYEMHNLGLKQPLLIHNSGSIIIIIIIIILLFITQCKAISTMYLKQTTFL